MFPWKKYSQTLAMLIALLVVVVLKVGRAERDATASKLEHHRASSQRRLGQYWMMYNF